MKIILLIFTALLSLSCKNRANGASENKGWAIPSELAPPSVAAKCSEVKMYFDEMVLSIKRSRHQIISFATMHDENEPHFSVEITSIVNYTPGIIYKIGRSIEDPWIRTTC